MNQLLIYMLVSYHDREIQGADHISNRKEPRRRSSLLPFSPQDIPDSCSARSFASNRLSHPRSDTGGRYDLGTNCGGCRSHASEGCLVSVSCCHHRSRSGCQNSESNQRMRWDRSRTVRQDIGSRNLVRASQGQVGPGTWPRWGNPRIEDPWASTPRRVC